MDPHLIYAFINTLLKCTWCIFAFQRVDKGSEGQGLAWKIFVKAELSIQYCTRESTGGMRQGPYVPCGIGRPKNFLF